MSDILAPEHMLKGEQLLWYMQDVKRMIQFANTWISDKCNEHQDQPEWIKELIAGEWKARGVMGGVLCHPFAKHDPSCIEVDVTPCITFRQHFLQRWMEETGIDVDVKGNNPDKPLPWTPSMYTVMRQHIHGRCEVCNAQPTRKSTKIGSVWYHCDPHTETDHFYCGLHYYTQIIKPMRNTLKERCEALQARVFRTNEECARQKSILASYHVFEQCMQKNDARTRAYITIDEAVAQICTYWYLVESLTKLHDDPRDAPDIEMVPLQHPRKRQRFHIDPVTI